MPDSKKPVAQPPSRGQPSDKEARLAEALRANLRKRKQQSRQRKGAGSDDAAQSDQRDKS